MSPTRHCSIGRRRGMGTAAAASSLSMTLCCYSSDSSSDATPLEFVLIATDSRDARAKKITKSDEVPCNRILRGRVLAHFSPSVIHSGSTTHKKIHLRVPAISSSSFHPPPTYLCAQFLRQDTFRRQDIEKPLRSILHSILRQDSFPRKPSRCLCALLLQWHTCRSLLTAATDVGGGTFSRRPLRPSTSRHHCGSPSPTAQWLTSGSKFPPAPGTCGGVSAI